MKKTTLVMALLATGLSASACVGDEALVYTVGNAFADPQEQCKVSDKAILPYGVLDIKDNAGSLQNYIAYFVMQTQLAANGTSEDGVETPSFPSYGSVSTNNIIIEEAEVSYDFGYAALPPEDRTLDILPQRFQQPVYAMINDKTKAGQGGTLTGAAFVTVELVAQGISAALLDDNVISAMPLEGRYPVGVNYKVRGRTSGGMRVETSDFVYRLDLCMDCKPGTGTCYPYWQF